MDGKFFFTVWHGEWLILKIESPYDNTQKCPNLNESTIAALKLRCEDLIRMLGWNVKEHTDEFCHFSLYLGEDKKICDIYP